MKASMAGKDGLSPPPKAGLSLFEAISGYRQLEGKRAASTYLAFSPDLTRL